MSKFTQENAKRLLESSDGKEFAQYIAEEIKKIDIVSDIEVTDPVKVAIEVKAKKIASNKLAGILSALFSGMENTMPKNTDKDAFKM
ncbi:MAG TPA: hypothetical protein ENI76_07460 [Ignavibacteria bacterium]|nr:hypothetical protein [Ignavibacteria bacterium]